MQFWSQRKFDNQLVHKGDRPYNFNICNTAFKHKSDLGHHVKGVHEKIKPFKCDVCTM